MRLFSTCVLLCFALHLYYVCFVDLLQKLILGCNNVFIVGADGGERRECPCTFLMDLFALFAAQSGLACVAPVACARKR
jgi:hypothetical protein